jgi:maleylacetoacetate isomerase
VNGWYRHWIEEGFRAIETLVEGEPFCFGGQPGLADVALVPQVYNARRFDVPRSIHFPRSPASMRPARRSKPLSMPGRKQLGPVIA